MVVVDKGGLHLTVRLLLRPELLLVEELQHIVHRQEEVHSTDTRTHNRLPHHPVPDLHIENYFTNRPEEEGGVDQFHRMHAELAIDILVDARPTQQGELFNPVETDQSDQDERASTGDD